MDVLYLVWNKDNFKRLNPAKAPDEGHLKSEIGK